MYIKVVVTAGAKKEKFVEKEKDVFEIAVKEKALKNMANRKVVALVAGHFRLPQGKVRIINGHHHPHKLLSIDL